MVSAARSVGSTRGRIVFDSPLRAWLVAGVVFLSGCASELPAAEGASARCDPGYVGACLDPDAADYDCEGGEGDGPRYVGSVEVRGDDTFDLDRDGDGYARE